MRLIKYALLGSLAITTPALAADLSPQPVEPMAPVVLPFSWTGFYAGVHAGAVFGQSKISVPAIPARASFDSTGFIGGAHVGYNEQFDSNIVIGIEGDFDYSSLNKSKTIAADGTSARVKFKNDWQGSVRARAGYAFDRFLPYITGGVAFADQKFNANWPSGGGSISNTRTGWTAGAGLEYAIDQNWLVRGEVRYSDFGKDSTHVQGAAVKTRFDETTATLGVSYKF